MKKLKISRASTAVFLIVVIVLLLTTNNILTAINQISSASPGVASRKAPEDLVRSDKILGTESSSSKNDGVQGANVLAVDVDLLKEQNHNNKQVDKVHDDGQNDPILNSTKIMAEHIKTETNDTE